MRPRPPRRTAARISSAQTSSKALRHCTREADAKARMLFGARGGHYGLVFDAGFIDGAQGEPVGADAVPFLNQETIRFEELANARARPTTDVFENGHQNDECVVPEDGALCDMRDLLR